MKHNIYVIAFSGCTQILWNKQTFSDYDINLDIVSLKCDNKSVICLSKNFVLHYSSKHIDVRHHFLRDNLPSPLPINQFRTIYLHQNWFLTIVVSIVLSLLCLSPKAIICHQFSAWIHIFRYFKNWHYIIK